MMLIRKHNTKKYIRSGIHIILVIVLGIFIYCIHSYIRIYKLEQREQITIRNMERNMFPPILQYINIPYKITGLSTDNTLLDSTLELELSDNFSNYKKSWTGDCILSIPDINLEKIVYTGANRLEHLKEYGLATAADNMKYKNGGNYIICGHASRLYGHSLNRIKEIQKGTIIYVKTPNRTDRYMVNRVTFENMHETSKFCNQTPEPKITIISCAKYISKESYIVIQAIPN